LTSDQQHIENEGLNVFIPQILRFFPLDMRNLSVLDVGCGPGIIAQTLGKRGANVFGLDCDSSFVERANTRGVHASFCNLEADKFPYVDALFDKVLCVEVIEHLAKPEKSLREIARVLKPNGTLLLTTPNLAALQNRLKLLRGQDFLNGNPFDRPYDRHIRLYAKNSITQLLSSWFEIKEIAYLNHSPKKAWKTRGRDVACIFKRDLGATMLLICQLKKKFD
jgi:2-polyprenyl-3-methyl-5-hydroxy-6-metoxy-1,4-benzoquinol methylase